MSDPWVYMLIGLPCSGKSTFARMHRNEVGSPFYHVVSSDEYIDKVANVLKSTYTQVFPDVIKHSLKAVNKTVEEYVKQDISFTWDQTNLDMKRRRNKLAMLPKHYRRAALFFQCPMQELLERNEVRMAKTGKNIPQNVFEDMFRRLEIPYFEEGFDRIDMIDGYGKVIRTEERSRPMHVLLASDYYK